MSDSLFTDEQLHGWPVHGCAGDVCQVCALERQKRGMDTALSAKDEWRQKADAWFRLRPKGYRFTSEDVTAAVGLPSGDVGTNQNNAVGAYMRRLAQAGVVRKVEVVTSSRVSSHGASLVLWERL